MERLKDNLKELISVEQIDEAVTRLAKEIEIDYHGREIIMICPLKGSFMFISDLTRKIPGKQKFDFVYLKAIERGATVKIEKDLSLNVTDKHVLIIEEIIDTGRTLNFLRDRIMSSNPATLKIVTLLDKPARREIALKPDYIGMTIDDRYVVGYGMDSDEKGRNYPAIYCFKN